MGGGGGGGGHPTVHFGWYLVCSDGADCLLNSDLVKRLKFSSAKYRNTGKRYTLVFEGGKYVIKKPKKVDR